MAMIVRMVGGMLLIAHGLVHLLYVADDVDEFNLEDSWLLPEASRQSIGIALMWATVVAFGLLGLAVWGVPGLASIWPIVAIVASVLSLVLMVVFWSRSLVFGVLIDLVIIAIAVLQPDWTERLDG